MVMDQTLSLGSPDAPVVGESVLVGLVGQGRCEQESYSLRHGLNSFPEAMRGYLANWVTDITVLYSYICSYNYISKAPASAMFHQSQPLVLNMGKMEQQSGRASQALGRAAWDQVGNR